MKKLYFALTILFCFSAPNLWSQSFSLQGKVFFDNNDAATGVNIYIPKIKKGTSTDMKGDFELKDIPAGNYSLVVTFTGMKTIHKELNIDKNINDLSFTMYHESDQLNEVVVTGTGTRHKLSNTPVQTVVIGKHTIKQLSPQNVENLLLNVSPSFDFGPNSMGANMTLNGLNNKYILVMIDGKRIYGDVAGNNDLNRINPNDIERIEVVKGASSSLYGSEAVAGTINIITKKNKHKVAVTNSSQFGEFNQWQQANSVALKLNKLNLTSRFNRKQSDGWQLSPYEMDKDELVETAKMTMNAFTDYAFSQNVEYQATSKLKLDATASYYTKDVERPEEAYTNGFYFEDLNYSLNAIYQFNEDNMIQAGFNTDNYKYFYKYNQEKGDFRAGDIDIQKDQLHQEANLKSTFKIGKRQLLSSGIQMVREQMNSERLINDKSSATTLAVFAQDEIQVLKGLTAVAGIRYTAHQNFGNAFTPKATLLQKVGPFNLRAAYGRGFKSPTVHELFYAYEKRGTLYSGNTNLKPQESDYYSVSAEFQKSFLTSSISFYQNDLKNMIAYETGVLTPELEEQGIKKVRQFTNIGAAKTSGIDFLLNVRLPYNFSFGGGYSYVDAQNLTDEIRLEGIAQNYFNVCADWWKSWKKYRLNLGFSGRIQDEKFYDDGNAKAYQIYKFVTSHRISSLNNFNIDFNLGVDNIFNYVDDSPYGSHYGTINPGRTIFGGITVNFLK